ncbi:MAG: DUF2809 domain-containing protein [Lachnospiraceae bacterium]|nr:DUF2809 domain-containing protein [Lachnospiraceae bacterium]
MTLQNQKKNGRTKYSVTFLLLLMIEVLIALYVHDDFIRPYIGDVLVVIVVYCFIRIWIPDRCRLLPLYVFLFAAGVEVLQYFDLVRVLGLEENVFLRVLIGSVFDWEDILCYAVGCVVLVGYEVLGRRFLKR